MKEPIITIDWSLLDNISYRSRLNKSLKNTLRKFGKEELFSELDEMISYFTEHSDEIKESHRVKSLQSCALKYKKYYPSTPVEKAFNDILGIRLIVDNYDIVEKMDLPDGVRVVDLSSGKAVDDGYRAIHLYYQKDHFHYPIEVQIMTPKDRQFNEWLHVYLYKYTDDHAVGCKLRNYYECGIILSEDDFRKEMQKCVT